MTDTKFKGFTDNELRALKIKTDDFQTTATMDVGIYVKSMNSVCRELGEELKKRGIEKP